MVSIILIGRDISLDRLMDSVGGGFFIAPLAQAGYIKELEDIAAIGADESKRLFSPVEISVGLI